MRGSSTEILDWITHHHEYAPLMQMSRQRLVGLRYKMHEGKITEHRKEELLTRLKNRMESLESTEVSAACRQCHKIYKVRDAYIMPAIIRDAAGRLYQETTFVKWYSRYNGLEDLNLNRVVHCGIDNGKLPREEVVKEVVRRKKATIVEPRMYIPSVWEVECDLS